MAEVPKTKHLSSKAVVIPLSKAVGYLPQGHLVAG